MTNIRLVNKLSNLHFTIGGPYFEEYKNCSYSKEWWNEYEQDVNPFYFKG